MRSIRGRRILVTGCAGFIGRHLTARLAALGASVIGLDERIVTAGTVETFLAADVAAPLDDLDIPPVDTVVHLAAITGVERASRDPLATFSVNFLGTMHVAGLAKRLGAKQFCFLSSSEVYGEASVQPIGETARLEPRSSYGLSKQCAETALALAASESFNVLVIRPFNVYGPGQREDFVVPRFFQQSLARTVHTFVGDGKQSRTFTYVEDLMRALVLSLEQSSRAFDVYNVAGAEPATIEMLAAEIDAITGHAVRADMKTPAELGRPPEAEIYNRIPSIAKARSELDYEPRFTLRDGLRRTFESMLGGVSV